MNHRCNLTALFAAILLALPASAQTPAALKAGVYVSPPFVTPTDDGFDGMAIELWEALANDMGLESHYTEFDTFSALVNATASGEIDVAVTNLTITKNRAERIDFTQPWYDAGLRIMTSSEPTTGFGAVIGGLKDSGYLRAYGWLALIILLSTFILTLFDRRFDKKFPERWRDGVAQSFYTVMSVATSGKPPDRGHLFGWLGKIWSALWLVCGIVVLSYVTSTVTSVMTRLAVFGEINGPADLPGRIVGVFTGSVAEEFAAQAQLRFRSYPNIFAAADALEAGTISAVIGDAPVLEYFVHSNPDRPLSVVGELFEPDKYGFATPPGSPLTKRITIELLDAHEQDRINALNLKYFGSN